MISKALLWHVVVSSPQYRTPLAAFPGGERRGTAWEKAYAHEGERRHGATLPHASASMPGVRSNSRTGAHCRVREKAGRRL